jgi:hypothetical protein
MRTKALLCLAALAVSAATAVAQSNVYSLNIVGYVNVDVTPGWNLLSVPLKPSDGNNQISNTIVLPDDLDGSTISTWGGTSFVSGPNWVAGEGWLTAQGNPVNLEIPVGEAFFMFATAAGKITYVGEVMQGEITYNVVPGVNMLANKVPVDEAFPGQASGQDGDVLLVWKGNWNESWDYVAGEGWINASNPSTAGPTLKVGNGLVYRNNNATAFQWTRSFNPQ